MKRERVTIKDSSGKVTFLKQDKSKTIVGWDNNMKKEDKAKHYNIGLRSPTKQDKAVEKGIDTFRKMTFGLIKKGSQEDVAMLKALQITAKAVREEEIAKVNEDIIQQATKVICKENKQLKKEKEDWKSNAIKYSAEIIKNNKIIEELRRNQWLTEDDTGLCTHCSEEGCAFTKLQKENEELKGKVEKAKQIFSKKQLIQYLESLNKQEINLSDLFLWEILK